MGSACLVVCLYGLTAPAAAQTDSTDDEEDDVPTVETVAPDQQQTQDPRHPSGWVSRLKLEGLFGDGEGLAESVRTIPGVTVQQSGGLGQPSRASVRGGNPRQMPVLLNGVDIGAPSGRGFDIGTLSTIGFDHLDIYRGSAASVHGSGAVTGAMNLEIEPPDTPGTSIYAQSLGGSYDVWGLSGGASVSRESGGFEFDASWRTGDGNFPFVDDQQTTRVRLNNDHRQITLVGTGEVGLDGADPDDHGVDATMMYAASRRGTPGPSEFQDAFSEARTETRHLAVVGGWHEKGIVGGEKGALDLEADLGLTRRSLEYTNPQPFLGETSIRNTTDHWAADASVTARGFINSGHIVHASLGARVGRYVADYRGQTDATLEATRVTASAGLSEEWLIFDDALSLIGGLRVEFVQGRQRTFVPWIPSAGAIWRALDWLRLRANVARTYRVPDFDELYLRTETLRGNPDLQPERALQVDGGVEVGADGWPVTGSVTAFHSDIRQSIFFLPETAYLYRATNLSGAQSTGLESTLQARPTPWIRARAAYTFTDAHLDATPEVQLPHRPRHQGSARVSMHLAKLPALSEWDHLHGLTLNASSWGRSGVNLDNFGNLTNRPYWQIDLGLQVQPLPWLSASLRLQNITDNRWGADSLQRPLPGRTLFGSIRLFHESAMAQERTQ
jgi:iron complex outermembrane receptor protein